MLRVGYNYSAFMKDYENKSIEEIRYEDYLENRKRSEMGLELLFPRTRRKSVRFGTATVTKIEKIGTKKHRRWQNQNSLVYVGSDGTSKGYRKTIEVYEDKIDGDYVTEKFGYNCTVFMKDYSDKSFEELRYEDYLAGRKQVENTFLTYCYNKDISYEEDRYEYYFAYRKQVDISSPSGSATIIGIDDTKDENGFPYKVQNYAFGADNENQSKLNGDPSPFCTNHMRLEMSTAGGLKSLQENNHVLQSEKIGKCCTKVLHGYNRLMPYSAISKGIQRKLSRTSSKSSKEKVDGNKSVALPLVDMLKFISINDEKRLEEGQIIP